MLPVGLCEWKITNAHPILTVMVKNVLITFEAEILKIFEKFSLSPKRVYSGYKSLSRLQCTVLASGKVFKHCSTKNKGNKRINSFSFAEASLKTHGQGQPTEF